jgi:glutamyl endopeptidase
MNKPTLVFSVSLALISTAATGNDTPVGDDGLAGVAPLAISTGLKIAPRLGTGLRTPESIIGQGAESVQPNDSFPKTALDTVAYGNTDRVGESIINWDSRTRSYTVNYPSRAIVFIEYNGAHLCTGYMYSARMVATAGHCVHTGGTSGGWRNPSLYRVYPGRDGASSPYGSCTVSRLHSVVGWTQSRNPRYDYGAMRLNCTIGNTVGWFGLYDVGAAALNQAAIIGGYPGDKPRQNWTSADKIRSTSAEMLGYRMDTVGGHSGSPIWHDRSDGTAANGAWAIAVHAYGVGTLGANMNSGPRLSAPRIQNYVNWRDQP